MNFRELSSRAVKSSETQERLLGVVGALGMMSYVCLIAGCGDSGRATVLGERSSYSKASSVQIIDRETQDWPHWRGPNRNGIAAEAQAPVNDWDENTHVIWKAKIPGRGHASPVIVGNQLFLSTADKTNDTMSLICVDRHDGSLLWETVVNHGGFRPRIHTNNTYASSTIASDGERLFSIFEHHEGIHLYCHDLSGELIWTKHVGEYQADYPFGFGGSPLLYDGKVYVTGETDGGSIFAFQAEDGEEVWRVQRKFTASFTSPIVATIADREMLLISGGTQVNAYDPLSGEEIWQVPAKWHVTCGTMVWDGNMVFASGGFPAHQTLGINAIDGEIIWENGIKCYEQSLLAFDGYIYGISDRKVAYCWRASDGEEMWKQRLASNSGGVSASPVLANGYIYACLEDGTTHVFKANPHKFESAAINRLGDSSFATPTIVDSKIYLRVGNGDQDWLYCIGQ